MKQNKNEIVMKESRIIALFVLLLSMGSCGIYSSYQRPDLSSADSLYRESPPVVEDTANLASLSWRELFTDQKLVAWIEMGLEQNTDLRIARLKVEEASAALKASKLAFIPSFDFSAEGGLEKSDNPNYSKSYSVGITSEWEIDFFGRLRNAKKQNLAALEQSEAYRQAVQTQLIATIADMYYSLLMLDKKLDITKKTCENWSKTAQMMEALKDAGQTNSAAVSQARADELTARQSVLMLEKEIYSLENSFSSLVGIVSGEIDREDDYDLTLPAAISIGVPLEMIGNRPDVMEAEYNLAKAFYVTNETRSNFYPKITLGGSGGWLSNAGDAIENPANWLLKAVGSLVQPLFKRGRNRAELKIAEARQEEALLSYRQKILDVGNEVNDALKQWQTAGMHLELSKMKVKELSSALESTELQMQYGTVNYLEILTAQQALLQAQLSEAEDVYDRTQGMIQLYHALGGGVD
ncbi:MAG: TolC family protein [Candidatus Cryptobacteroides sp.]